MDLRDWPVYPWQVDGLVAYWLRQYRRLLRLDSVVQYTRHTVHALTVTDPSVPAAEKREHLFYVPHAHEPAGTAGCLNFVSQLLSGHHLDGSPSTLARADILRRAVLTFIPDANPYGRARCPEPWWDGRRYNNREFVNMVFGIGDLYSEVEAKPRWERFKRVRSFSTAEVAPGRIGLVYEQVSAHEYVEPGRYDERGALVRLVRKLRASHHYSQVLSLHQTEFDYSPTTNCMLMPPNGFSHMVAERQARLLRWAERVQGAWRSVGGDPEPLEIEPDASGGMAHPSDHGPLDAELEQDALCLVSEVQNNSPRTPAEEQLLLTDAAIWSSVEHLLLGD